jgi:hypothetical protein
VEMEFSEEVKNAIMVEKEDALITVSLILVILALISLDQFLIVLQFVEITTEHLMNIVIMVRRLVA